MIFYNKSLINEMNLETQNYFRKSVQNFIKAHSAFPVTKDLNRVILGWNYSLKNTDVIGMFCWQHPDKIVLAPYFD